MPYIVFIAALAFAAIAGIIVAIIAGRNEITVLAVCGMMVFAAAGVVFVLAMPHAEHEQETKTERVEYLLPCDSVDRLDGGEDEGDVFVVLQGDTVCYSYDDGGRAVDGEVGIGGLYVQTLEPGRDPYVEWRVVRNYVTYSNRLGLKFSDYSPLPNSSEKTLSSEYAVIFLPEGDSAIEEIREAKQEHVSARRDDSGHSVTMTYNGSGWSAF